MKLSQVTPGETLGTLYNIHVGSNKTKQHTGHKFNFHWQVQQAFKVCNALLYLLVLSCTRMSISKQAPGVQEMLQDGTTFASVLLKQGNTLNRVTVTSSCTQAFSTPSQPAAGGTGPGCPPSVGLIKQGNTPNRRNVARARQLMQHRRLCLLYTSPSPRDQRGSRMPSSA